MTSLEAFMTRVAWSDVSREEEAIRTNPTVRKSVVGMGALKSLLDAWQSNDPAGPPKEFLKELVRKGYPWVATKTTFECVDNLFIHCRNPGIEVWPEMVWGLVYSIRDALREGGYLEQLGDLLSYAAANWATGSEQSIELHVLAANALLSQGVFPTPLGSSQALVNVLRTRIG